MEGCQAKPTHKFYNGKKVFKQPSTCSTEKRSRTHQQIQYIPIIHPERQKRSCQLYICLFTCTALQAIHLEIVEDQTASLFVRAFRQFVCKRGIPEYIISDNAKTFQKGSQELNTPKNQILNTTEPQRFLAYHQRKWKFITE